VREALGLAEHSSAVRSEPLPTLNAPAAQFPAVAR
jgi:hypothetical protein